MRNINTRDDALQFLKSLQAPKSLVVHAELVSDVATQLIRCLLRYEHLFDEPTVIVGAVLHDIGKILYPQELYQDGHNHEIAGYQLLLEHEFPSQIADICKTHSQWQTATSLDALLVSLSDKLWKGKRNHELEDEFIRQIAARSLEEFWAIFSQVMPCLDEIANGADARIAKAST